MFLKAIVCLLPLLLGCSFTKSYAQSRAKLDSLLRTEKGKKSDTLRVKHLLLTSINYRKISADSALPYAQSAFSLCSAIRFERLYAKCFFEKLNCYKVLLRPKVFFDSALAAYNDPLVAKHAAVYQAVCQELGIVCRKTGNLDKSVSYFLECLKLALQSGENIKIYYAYNSLANTYSQAGNTKKSAADLRRALENYQKAQEYVDEKNLPVIAMIMNNRGAAWSYIAQLDKDSAASRHAIKEYEDALRIIHTLNDTPAVAQAYSNLGSTYQYLTEVFQRKEYFNKANECYEQALNLTSHIRNEDYYHYRSNYASFLTLRGQATNDRRFLTEAVKLGLECEQFFESNADVYTGIQNKLNLATAHKLLGEYKKAYEFMEESNALRDTILKIESRQIAEELTAKYESDLKDSENKNLKQQAGLREEVIARKSNTIKIMFVASGLILVLAGLVFYSRQKIRAQKLETERQKLLLEEKQKEILDSINYSKRLQDAAIPSMEQFKMLLPSSFVFYQPKDIVAGDFYWIHETQSQAVPQSAGKAGSPDASTRNSILVAAADCTGHGVPGALVSIACLNALNRCVEEFHLEDPAAILDRSSTIIQQSFRQSENDVKDGMDISLCKIDFAASTVYFAGANNHLWIVRDGGLKELKGDSQPVGKQMMPKPFALQTCELKANDLLILASDGYADQFGGSAGKKMKSKKFKEMLARLHGADITEIEKAVREEYFAWKGHLEQIDDVLVIGIRI